MTGAAARRARPPAPLDPNPARRDADRPRAGGRVTIALEDVDLGPGYADSHGGVHLVAGPYVLLAVSDTGCGMDRQILAQKQHGGLVWAYSEPGTRDDDEGVPAGGGGRRGPGDDVVLRGLLPSGAPFIQKPFTPEALVREVGALLGRRA